MSDTSHHDQTGWEGILDHDETIIWQGRPDGGFHLTPGMPFTIIFALFFSGFALFWMIMAARAGGLFWTFGLIHFGVGLALLFGTTMGPSFVRRRTWYTLTNQPAFIAKNLPIAGRSLKSYPITSDMAITLTEGRKQSIYFASKRDRNDDSAGDRKIGFEQISDARDVLKLIRAIQKDKS
ncbi:aspartate carbamoyltransferase catalytic subunit [Cognatiyoonia sp. IB215182]|uniref:aspartate carbamoyltransferase catalytic subunit n=1 Tax=Cognatiyoonia sp. IB215182 TaxID=3097353 RepID=UPI002A1784EC|nr:aspartate carbamoyltransferase catalytic subunit [Cognatiyoonia sp. IB215182]MDX8354248.1 aspartate carbamoyltransferase catalytic subunit [Cognatiyoonia sp. IB215182]